MTKRLTILITILLFGIGSAFAAKKATYVKFTTTEGVIKVKLYNETPLHRDNFLKLVKAKTYEGTLFHRVIKDFMIQGGDPTSVSCDSAKLLGEGDLGYTIPAEIVYPQYYHKAGALAAARTSDAVNPKRESSSCQFYIVVGRLFTDNELDRTEQRVDHNVNLESPFKFTAEQRKMYKTIGGTPHLDMQYTVFGEVVEGMDIVLRINHVDTDKNDRPQKDIRILKAKIVNK